MKRLFLVVRPNGDAVQLTGSFRDVARYIDHTLSPNESRGYFKVYHIGALTKCRDIMSLFWTCAKMVHVGRVEAWSRQGLVYPD